MEIASLIGHTSELLRIALKSNLPTDRIAREYLRAKKYLGASDRRFISELLYSILRINSFPDFIKNSIIANDKFNQIFSNRQMSDVLYVLISILVLRAMKIEIASYPVEFMEKSINLREIIDYLAKQTSKKFDFDVNLILDILNGASILIDELVEKTNNPFDKDTQDSSKLNIFAVRFGLQTWILESLMSSSKYSNSELKQLSESLFSQAAITLRINTEQSERENINVQLREFDPLCKYTEFSPFGLTLSKRIDLNTVPMYKNGLIDVQDEGSQLISIALAPMPGESILDACTGAGGKSMHICSLMKNSGEIISTDVELGKLKELNKRAKKSGFDIISTYLVKNHSDRTYDRVLIDAPCSGMGTVRRNPMLKWSLTPKLLKKYNQKQFDILCHNSEFVKDGGILLYATCSILPSENEIIIKRFLDSYPEFYPEPLKPSFDDYGVSLPELTPDDYQYQLLPSVHSCDGFYFAKLRRKS